MNVNELERLSFITLRNKLKCFIPVKHYGRVFNNEHNLYPKMSVK